MNEKENAALAAEIAHQRVLENGSLQYTYHRELGISCAPLHVTSPVHDLKRVIAQLEIALENIRADARHLGLEV